MIWVAFVLNLAVAVGFMVVGGTVVRRAAKAPGMLLVGAGAIELLTMCCIRVTSMVSERGAIEGEAAMRVAQVSMLGSACTDVIVVGLIIAALVGLAKSLRAADPGAPS